VKDGAAVGTRGHQHEDNVWTGALSGTKEEREMPNIDELWAGTRDAITVRRVFGDPVERDGVTIVPTRYPSEVQGPIAYGQELGEADVLQDGRKIATVALVAATEVPKPDLAQRTKSWFSRPLAVVLAFAVLGGTVLVARRRRRPRGPGPRRAREEARAA
jgi:hypothetical protein